MAIERWDDQTEQAWAELQERLEEWLADGPEDLSVVIQLAWPEVDLSQASPYVQVAIEDLVVRTEAVSNHYLDPTFRLDDVRVGELLALGWLEPPDERPGNFWRDDELPEDAGPLAEVIVASLRDVYGVPAPSFLEAAGFGQSGPLEEDELPLGLRLAEVAAPAIDVTSVVAQDADELRDLAAEAVASVVEHEEFDADGDIPVPAGNTVIYVRVEEDSPSISLFAAVLSDVRWTPRVGHTLNQVNARIPYGRLVFHRGHVLVQYRLLARPFVPELLRQAIIGMTGLVDGLDLDLHGRIGGNMLSDHQDGVA